jgi:putative oxidoreductase
VKPPRLANLKYRGLCKIVKAHPFIKFVSRVFKYLPRLEWLLALGTRLFVGYFFMDSGWGKVHNMDQFIGNFKGWGFPFPALTAGLCAYTELIGGALTIVGLGTRFVSLTQMINMLVAILVVNLRDTHSLDDFALLDEPLYLLIYAWLGMFGPGWVSLDALVKRFIATPLISPNENTAARETARAEV